MNYYDLACSMKDETIRHRRYFHQNAEVGLHLPKAKQYIMETLTQYGISPSSCTWCNGLDWNGAAGHLASRRYGCLADAGRVGPCVFLSHRKRSALLWTRFSRSNAADRSETPEGERVFLKRNCQAHVPACGRNL